MPSSSKYATTARMPALANIQLPLKVYQVTYDYASQLNQNVTVTVGGNSWTITPQGAIHASQS